MSTNTSNPAPLNIQTTYLGYSPTYNIPYQLKVSYSQAGVDKYTEAPYYCSEIHVVDLNIKLLVCSWDLYTMSSGFWGMACDIYVYLPRQDRAHFIGPILITGDDKFRPALYTDHIGAVEYMQTCFLNKDTSYLAALKEGLNSEYQNL